MTWEAKIPTVMYAATDCGPLFATSALSNEGYFFFFLSFELFFFLCCLSRFIMTNKFYEGSARYWSTLDSVEIKQDEGKIATFNVSVISAPAEYSFHCQLVGTSTLYPARLIPSNSEASNWDVFISSFQVSTHCHFRDNSRNYYLLL